MEDIQVDRISALPDEIVHHIFSFLNIVDVVHTNILSSRWRYMWRSTPFLNFNFDEWLKEHYHLWSNTTKSKRVTFMEFVSKILVLGEDSNISKFCLHGGFKECRLLEWIKSALRRRVEHVCLRIPIVEPFNFPHNLFTENIRVLELLISYDNLFCYPEVRLPSSLCTAPLLKILRLSNVIFPEGDADGELILKCPLLEALEIFHCEVKHLNSLIISTPRLESLEVKLSDERDPCTVKVCTPNLKSLKLTTTFMDSRYALGDYCFEDLASLFDVEFYVRVQNEEDLRIWREKSPHLLILCSKFLTKILPKVNSMQALKVSMHAIQVLAETPQLLERVPHLLHNLKYLMLIDWWVLVSVPAIVNFLQRLPCMERLVWRKPIYEQKMTDSEEEEWVAMISSSPQNNFESGKH